MALKTDAKPEFNKEGLKELQLANPKAKPKELLALYNEKFGKKNAIPNVQKLTATLKSITSDKTEAKPEAEKKPGKTVSTDVSPKVRFFKNDKTGATIEARSDEPSVYFTLPGCDMKFLQADLLALVKKNCATLTEVTDQGKDRPKITETSPINMDDLSRK
jgi:hypothetical protein